MPLEFQVCQSCKLLREEIVTLKGRVTRLQKRISNNQEHWVKTFQEFQQQNLTVNAETQTPDEIPTAKVCLDMPADVFDEREELPEPLSDQKNEYDSLDDDPTWSPEELESAYKAMKDDDDDSPRTNENPRLNMQGKDVREEPKGIVFISKLLLLFRFCHLCFFPNPEVSMRQTGTMLTIEAKCCNCKEVFEWKSQPFILSKLPAGNLLMSLAVLCAGSSIKKILLVLKHMGVLAFHEPTFYYHQRHFLIPSVVSFWRKYQKKILESIKGKEVVLAGDGRHDSMGHSAKFGTYTIFCCTIGLIVHLVLVQANQAGSSTAMEFLAFQKAFTFMLGSGIIIKSFISDRHASIAKWMREECPNRCKDLGKPIIDHFFDLWHIAKSKYHIQPLLFHGYCYYEI
ncbi:PREDICTED: uncharacterized protein LOC107354556 [Acropora digitifera]|uniref:uncharacterized protein LOC107354556 n=1 Tax=Acropora digitifera TaxID=70779 RepID=UPI00077AA8D1|nr:PREDICTED: uncharacterized protein LOC107354556 [Acropora digitifera]